MSDELSYYSRNKEARKAYQKAYYHRNKDVIRRQKELNATLNPEKLEKIRHYQREYYLKNREILLRKRKEKYLARKNSP